METRTTGIHPTAKAFHCKRLEKRPRLTGRCSNKQLNSASRTFEEKQGSRHQAARRALAVVWSALSSQADSTAARS